MSVKVTVSSAEELSVNVTVEDGQITMEFEASTTGEDSLGGASGQIEKWHHPVGFTKVEDQ